MALTKSFKDLVQRRVANDPAFGDALLCEGISTMLISAATGGRKRPARMAGVTSREQDGSRG